MAMQGSLEDMAVADLVQHNCQDRKTARLTIKHNGQEAILFFNEGTVQHATLDGKEGEEVVYETFGWQQGDFTLEMGLKAPTVTITRSWTGLLLEGAKRLDEQSASDADTELLHQEEQPEATKEETDRLSVDLQELLQETSDIEGAAIVGVDGLIYAAKLIQGKLDKDMLGAISAAVLGLSKRSVTQLKRGNFKRTLIQGKEGNIFVSNVTDKMLFVCLTDKTASLGITFSEIRAITKVLAKII